MNIDQLKTYQPPAKVTGLEMLATLGIPVPTIRQYIAADHAIPADLQFLGGLAGKPLMMRSAHPDEDRFLSGAFQSMFLRPQTIEHLPAVLAQTRANIVNHARSETNLQVARDIKFGNISGFQAEDMGIFINEYYEGYHLTIVPLEGNKYVICYFNNQGKPDGSRNQRSSIGN